MRSFWFNNLRYSALRRSDRKCQKMTQVVPLVAPLFASVLKLHYMGTGH